MADFVQKIEPVKLIMGFIFREEKTFLEVKKILREKFGDLDFESQIMDFNFTDYYEEEMGKDLKRTFISFQNLINLEDIVKIKHICWDIEQKFARNGKRIINIDPGYVSLFQLVLTTTKPFSHRIYLGEKVFAEVTLVNRHSSFEILPWTYPDYRTQAYLDIFDKIRLNYKKQIKNV